MTRFPEGIQRFAVVLLVLQATLILLLLFVLIVVAFVQSGYGLIFYLLTIAGLEALVILSLICNLRGNYPAASWLAMITMLLGPWISILFDPHVAGGDLAPIFYVVVPVLVCSIFLTERATVTIAAVQFFVLVLYVRLHPELMRLNVTSLLCFVFITSALGIISSFMVRMQMREIQNDKIKLEENEQRLRELSVRDALTGLYNRRYMEETLNREIAHASRQKQSLGVIMADIDGFKSINDTYGHAWGDAVLIRVANALVSGIRPIDVACRYGGDEYTLILMDCTLADAERIARNLHERVLKAAFVQNGRDIGPVTLSFGVAAFPHNGLTGEEVLNAADAALYAAKNKGRNAVVTAPMPAGYLGEP